MATFENMLVTGDDEGIIRVLLYLPRVRTCSLPPQLWDLRQQKMAFEFHEHSDYVSALALRREQNLLLSTRYAALAIFVSHAIVAVTVLWVSFIFGRGNWRPCLIVRIPVPLTSP